MKNAYAYGTHRSIGTTMLKVPLPEVHAFTGTINCAGRRFCNLAPRRVIGLAAADANNPLHCINNWNCGSRQSRKSDTMKYLNHLKIVPTCHPKPPDEIQISSRHQQALQGNKLALNYS